MIVLRKMTHQSFNAFARLRFKAFMVKGMTHLSICNLHCLMIHLSLFINWKSMGGLGCERREEYY